MKPRSLLTLAVLVLLAALPAPAGAAPRHRHRLRPAPAIQVLSTRADLVSGGSVLVAIGVPRRTRHVRVLAGRRNVSRAFARRANRRYEGLIAGLGVGRTVLRVSAPGRRDARLTVVDHPSGGPLFAGPQVTPWLCQNGSAEPQCGAPPSYSYAYKSGITGQMAPYDPKQPPTDFTMVRTQTGAEVPYIVRTETGYQDRDQYSISVLYDPAKPWKPWAPQPGFAHKLLITHGTSCGIDHQSGSAPATASETQALSMGFAVMSTALDNAGHNCNHVVMAESLIMAKEHLIDTYGTLRYTIGTGCSGGSLAQYEVANSYPGVYQGILPQCSFPDNWSTGQQLVDYHLDRAYLEHPEKWGLGVVWTPLDVAAVEGHPNHMNAVILDTLYWNALANPENRDCAGVTDAQRYSPATNPGGTRCTLADYMLPVFGPRPASAWGPVEQQLGHGFAGRPVDNVGVQYGLTALQSGTISPAQFADLNAKIGGSDIDLNPTAARTAADEPALRRAYESGAINETNNLRDVAIIDLRGSDDGTFHDAYRAFAVRARLDRANGTHANQVIWQGPVPLVGGADFTSRGLVAMDRWLAAVERDRRRGTLARKIIADRPTDVADTCYDGHGGAQPGTDCPSIVRVYKTPRIVAGEPVVTDVNKCQLKPLRREDYKATFTEAEWAALQGAFPAGVCDWTKPGVDQTPTLPWRTYFGRGGRVLYGGRSLGRPPARSGLGWSDPVFFDRREAIPGSR